MGCVTSVRYGILINGLPSPFFSSCRGIRQGFPLSLYIFILDIEGLSLLSRNAKESKTIAVVCFAGTINLTHLIFVDDVLLFGNGSVEEWCYFHAIISLFYEAFGLDDSNEKSSFIFANVDEVKEI